jgi:hypothetical protein
MVVALVDGSTEDDELDDELPVEDELTDDWLH